MASIAFSAGRVGVVQIPQIGPRAADDIVMVHGLGANLGFWYAGAVEWFRRFGNVTLFDLPGHGESEMPATGYSPARLADHLAGLFDHLGIERAHLVAHSFGGCVALAFAARYPTRVKSLVLADVRLWAVEPPVAADEALPHIQALRDAGLSLADPRYDASVQILVELARLRLAQGEPLALAAIAEVMPGARALFSGRRAARQWLRLIETTWAYREMTDPAALSLDDIARIEQPILALYGERSTCRLSGTALRLSCRQCQLAVIPDVGHFFPLTRPRLFARTALAFLRTTARTQARRHRSRPRGDAPQVVDAPPLAEPLAGAPLVNAPFADASGATDEDAMT